MTCPPSSVDSNNGEHPDSVDANNGEHHTGLAGAFNGERLVTCALS